MYRFLLLLAFLLAGRAYGQKPSGRYTITGFLTNLKGRTVYLTTHSKPTSSLHIIQVDSSRTTDGHFTFQGSIGEANYYQIRLKGEKPEQFKLFILDSYPVSLIGDADSLESMSVVGSPALSHQVLLNKLLETPIKQQRALEQLIGQAIQQGDTASQLVLGNRYNSVMNAIVDIKAAFIESRPSSLVSLFELNAIAARLPKEKIKNLWNQLDYSLQQHSVGKQIHDQAFDRATEPRQQTPNLILSDKQQKPVSLLSYKGNVLLIDFWASWCDHCRQEHNRLKSLYKQYKSKGLEIISISVDEDPKAWKKALQKAGLPWTQLSDRVGPKNVVGTQYSTNSIPMNVLIDQEGFVIRKGLHGAELEKQLALVLNNP